MEKLFRKQIKDECKKVIKNYDKFFKNKKRENDFKEFDCVKDEDTIDYIITAILLNIKSINPDDILKNIFKTYYEDTKKYEELFKYGNEEQRANRESSSMENMNQAYFTVKIK